MDQKSLESILNNPNLFESNRTIEDTIALTVTNFRKEVDQAMYQLLKLANIEGESIIENPEKLPEYKKKLNDMGISMEMVAHPRQPFRLFLQAMYGAKKEFVVGYLVDYRPQLEVIRRMRIDTEEERIGVLLYIRGEKDNYE